MELIAIKSVPIKGERKSEMQKIYEFITIGSGPSVISCITHLIKHGYKNILILEKGKKRTSVDDDYSTGQWLGNGTVLDGKLNLTHLVGGTFHEIIGLDKYYKYLKISDNYWTEFYPLQFVNKVHSPSEGINELKAKAIANNLNLLVYDIRHLGTDGLFQMGENLYNFYLENKIEIKIETEVINIRKESDLFYVTAKSGEEFCSKNVLVATGRSGGEFVMKTVKSFGIKTYPSPVDIGVRLEAPRLFGKSFTDLDLYELKLIGYENGIRNRTFCYCPNNAFVAKEIYKHFGPNKSDIICVNGHSYTSESEHQSDNLNFAILTTADFTEPFSDSLAYCESIVKLTNALAGGNSMMQLFGDLKRNKRSTYEKFNRNPVIPTLDSTPGDLAYAFPKKQLDCIINFIEKINSLMDGISGDATILHAPEIKFFPNKVKLSENCETEIAGLYLAGDVTSFSHGINQASVMGIAVAENLIKGAN